MERLVDLLGTHCSFGLLGVTIPRYYSTHETKDFSIYFAFHLENNLFLVNNTLFNCSRVEACSLLICNITCFCWGGRLAIEVGHCCLICNFFRYFWQDQQVGNGFVFWSPDFLDCCSSIYCVIHLPHPYHHFYCCFKCLRFHHHIFSVILWSYIVVS